MTSAVRRNLNEVRRARYNWSIRVRLESEDAIQPAADITFFHIVYMALTDDMISHAVRVLERGKAASFWYIYRCEKPAIDTFCQAKRIDLTLIADLADRIKHVRDKTHAHIDMEAVKNPRQVWKDAGITADAFIDALEGVDDILFHLWTAHKQPGQQLAEYDASDVERVIEAVRRDGLLPPPR